jgi:hypothetical protein
MELDFTLMKIMNANIHGDIECISPESSYDFDSYFLNLLRPHNDGQILFIDPNNPVLEINRETGVSTMAFEYGFTEGTSAVSLKFGIIFKGSI